MHVDSVRGLYIGEMLEGVRRIVVDIMIGNGDGQRAGSAARAWMVF
jgi:hypothetical protein